MRTKEYTQLEVDDMHTILRKVKQGFETTMEAFNH
jgi:hypothetical protein